MSGSVPHSDGISATIEAIFDIPIGNYSVSLAHEKHCTPWVMVFIFGGLGFGLVLQALLSQSWAKRFVNLPYTVAVMLSSLAIAGIVNAAAGTADQTSKVYARFTMAETNPKLIMTIFLPILIFDSAFRMEAHAVVKGITQIVLLAGPGVVLSAVIIGGFAHLVMPWTISVCFVFGAILSATDPVAVVSLLRELGAPHHVLILTEAESLFNDGTAIIAYETFMLFSQRDLDPRFAAESLVPSLCIQLVGIVFAPLIGLTAAKITEWALRATHNDAIREKGIILISVYGTYFVCELSGVSGVLALVVLGLWLSAKRHSISPETIEDNNRFWDFFSYWANTLIFILAGLVIAKPVIHSGSSLRDYGLIIFFYVVIIFTRCFVILLAFPILRRCGFGMPWRYAIALSWGGLRGAIGLLLALEMAEQGFIRETHGVEIGEKVILYVSGAVALTLIINATTFGALLKFLKMDKIPQHKIRLMANMVVYIDEVRSSVLGHLKGDRFLAAADWDLVERTTVVRNPYASEAALLQTLLARLHDLSQSFRLKTFGNNVNDGRTAEEIEAEAQEEGRQRILQLERVSYWRQYGAGLLSQQAIDVLAQRVEECAERPGAALDVKALRQEWVVESYLTSVIRFLKRISPRKHQPDLVTQHMLSTITNGSLLPPIPPAVSEIKRHPIMATIHAITTFLFVEFVAWLLALLALLIVSCELHTHFYPEENADEFSIVDQLRIIKIFIYSILLLHLIAKLAAWGRTYFQRLENVFESFFILIYAMCIILFAAKLYEAQPGLYFSIEVVASFRLFKIVFLLGRLLPHILSYLQVRVSERAGLAYDSTKGFILGEEEAAKSIAKLIQNPMLASTLEKGCQERRHLAIRHMATLQAEYPGAAVSVQTRQAARCCLNSIQDAVTQLAAAGILDTAESDHLAEVVQTAIQEIPKQIPAWISPPPPSRQLAHLPWVAARADQRQVIDYLTSTCRLLHHDPGTTIYRAGDKATGIYILISGVVRFETDLNTVTTHSKPAQNGISENDTSASHKVANGVNSNRGQLARRDTASNICVEWGYPIRTLGEVDVLVRANRHSETVTAEVVADTYFLSLADTEALLARNPTIGLQWALAFAIRKSALIVAAHPGFIGWTEQRLNSHLAYGELIDLAEKNGEYQRRMDGELVVLVKGVAYHTRRSLTTKRPIKSDVDESPRVETSDTPVNPTNTDNYMHVSVSETKFNRPISSNYLSKLEDIELTRYAATHGDTVGGVLIPSHAKLITRPASDNEEPGWLLSVPPASHKFQEDTPLCRSLTASSADDAVGNANNDPNGDTEERRVIFERSNTSLRSVLETERRNSNAGSYNNITPEPPPVSPGAGANTVDLLAAVNRVTLDAFSKQLFGLGAPVARSPEEATVAQRPMYRGSLDTDSKPIVNGFSPATGLHRRMSLEAQTQVPPPSGRQFQTMVSGRLDATIRKLARVAVKGNKCHPTTSDTGRGKTWLSKVAEEPSTEQQKVTSDISDTTSDHFTEISL